MNYITCPACRGVGQQTVMSRNEYTTKACTSCHGAGIVSKIAEPAGEYGPSLTTGLFIGLAMFALGCVLWLVVSLLFTHKLL